MALTVIQRPEEELFVEENPDVYDVPYFTSRWNAANLPLVYKITNTKFPINTEDTIESILSVANNGGFAELTLDASTYTFLNKGFVQVTNTTNYQGVWQIRQIVGANTIVINAPFVSTETGNVQNYYNNYNTLVKVYAGIPEYHPLNSTNPMSLITDNPITITPNSDNEAVVDVASLVKSQINLDNDYGVNDLNIWTALYIEYSEQYDESNGTTVSTTTESYTTDVIAGCDPGSADFVTNGDFATNLSGWTNSSTGVNWVQDTGAAQTSLSDANRLSNLLTQTGLGLTEGVEYTFGFDYVAGSETVELSIVSSASVYQEDLTGSGTVSFNFIAGATDSINFRGFLKTASSIDFRLDNVTVVNAQTNPCLAYVFTTHSAQQPQYKYGGNMGEYVQNFNGGQFSNKWLTLFEKPVLFKDNHFDISTIIPQNVIQSAIQAGGLFLELIEFDKNGVAIEENQYPITQNLGDGVYRFRLDDKDFNANTKEFTVQILRIPVNLFVDGDQGTFDTTTDTNGNPPSDWNLEKDTRAIINFDNTLSFEGAASLKFESRSIFNDNFALQVKDYRYATGGLDTARYDVSGAEFDFTDKWTISLWHYTTERVEPSIILSATSSTYDRANRLISMQTINSTTLVFDHRRLDGTNTRLTNTNFSYNQWNHFVLVFDKNNIKRFFVNNVETNSSVDVVLGEETIEFMGHIALAGGNPFSPILYSRYHKVFSGYSADSVDVNEMYNSGVPNDITPSAMTSFLVRNYKFNQEQSRDIFDTSTYEKNGELGEIYSDEELRFGGGAWVDVSGL